MQSRVPPNQTPPTRSAIQVKHVLSWLAMLFLVLTIIFNAYAIVTKQEMLITILGCISTGLSLIFAFIEAFPSARKHLQASWRFGTLFVVIPLLIISITLNVFAFMYPGAIVSLISQPSLTPSPPPHVIAHATETPSPTPTPDHIRLIACSTTSPGAEIVKFTTTDKGDICVTGTGRLSITINNVVRAENSTYSSWVYTTISTGSSHHSPSNGTYSCPGGRPFPYAGKSMMRVTQITIVSPFPSCTPRP